MMISLAEVGRLKHGDARLDCPQMNLVREDSDGVREYRGTGFIDCPCEGGLRFELTAEGETPLPGFGGHIHGVPLPDDAYYKLTAIDAAGRTWRAKRILPGISWSVDEAIVRGEIHRAVLAGEEEVATTAGVSEVELFLAHDFRLPTLGDIRFGPRSREFEVSLDQENGWTIIRITGRNLGLCDELRVREALQFVFATHVTPAFIQRRDPAATHQAEIFTGGLEVPALRLTPIQSNYDVSADAMNAMLSDYISMPAEPDCRTYSEVGAAWYRVIGAASETVELQQLVRSIAVEAEVNWLFRQRASGAKEGRLDADFEQLKSEILELLDKEGREEKLRNRVRAFLDNFHAIRAIDRLHILKDESKITLALIKAWKDARNPSAHGSLGNKEPILVLGRLYSLLTLLHYLTFVAISYEGKYTCYAERGWPVRAYPPEEGE